MKQTLGTVFARIFIVFAVGATVSLCFGLFILLAFAFALALAYFLVNLFLLVFLTIFLLVACGDVPMEIWLVTTDYVARVEVEQ